MRRLLTQVGLSAVLFSLTFGIVAAADDPPKLAGSAGTYATVPWGSAPDIVKATLAQRGFTYVQTDTDGDLVFNGKTGPVTATVFEVLDPSQQLVKSLISLQPAERDLLDLFHDLTKAMTEKYGTPSAIIEEYHDPYSAASSNADKRAAIAAGNATLATFWMYADGSSVYVVVTNKLTLEASYESPQWSAEAARRKAATATSP